MSETKLIFDRISNMPKTELESIVLKNFSFRELMRSFGATRKKIDGGNLIKFKKIISEKGIKTSHFTGKAWKRGKNFEYKFPLILYLKLNGKSIHSCELKIRLINEGIKDKKCERCGKTKWQKIKIPLELHHKNGNKKDNSIDNLEILCPNCHSITNNYCGKNISKFSKDEKNKIIKESSFISHKELSLKYGIKEWDISNWNRALKRE